MYLCKMKAYKIEVLFLAEEDYEKDMFLYNVDDAYGQVMSIEEKDIGEWHDDHPLNKIATQDEAYRKLFNI